MTMDIRGVFLIVPALVLVLGVLLVGWSLIVSLGRRRAWKGWATATGTVTGVLHGPDGVARGRHRFAPSYEFRDGTGARRSGRGDVFGPYQHIIGAPIEVLYDTANPDRSAVPGVPAARQRLSTGLLCVLFGVLGLAMFRSFLQ